MLVLKNGIFSGAAKVFFVFWDDSQAWPYGQEDFWHQQCKGMSQSWPTAKSYCILSWWLCLKGGQDGKVRIYNLAAGEQVYEYAAADDTVNGVQFHPFLPLVATASGKTPFADPSLLIMLASFTCLRCITIASLILASLIAKPSLICCVLYIGRHWNMQLHSKLFQGGLAFTSCMTLPRDKKHRHSTGGLFECFNYGFTSLSFQEMESIIKACWTEKLLSWK